MDLVQIREFLSIAVPWPLDLGLPGYVSIHVPYGGGIPGRPFTDLNSAVNYTQGTARAMKGDLYVCMSVQSTTKPSQSGKRMMIDRAKEHSLFLRSFYLELDLFDPKKPKERQQYKTSAEAAQAFRDWRVQLGMPDPTFVLWSGSGGYHFHWVTPEIMPVAVWQPLADALKNACEAGGLLADPVVTNEPSRLLRIPGTSNFKHTPPKDVILMHSRSMVPLADIEAVLGKYKGSPATYAPRVTTPSAIGKPSAAFAGVKLPGRLDEGIETWKPTIEQVAEVCPFIANDLATGGVGRTEPEWREAIAIAYYVQDGPNVVHELSWNFSSSRYEYNADETDEKYLQIEATHSGGKLGPHSCATIGGKGVPECVTCPNRGSSSSPVNLVKMITTAVAAVAVATAPIAASVTTPAAVPVDWPQGFKQDPNGIVYTMIEDPKDPRAPPVRANVMPYPILNMWAHRPSSSGGQWAISFIVQTTRTDIIEASVSYKEYMDPRKLKDALGDQGIGLDPSKYIPLLGKLMASFVERLRTSNNRIEDSYSLGWHRSKVDAKMTGFVFDGLLRNGTGSRPVSIIDRTVKELYTPCGNLDDWKRIAGLIFAQRRPPLEAIIAMAVGAPLIGLTGYKGGIFSSWSPQTGVQKTNTTKVAQSFWGDPNAGLGGLSDTPNFVVQRLGSVGSLPYCWDDLQTTDDNRKFANIVMQGPQGRSKGRQHRSGMHNNPVTTWENIIIVNSNTSLVVSISDVLTQTVAGAVRVLEQLIPHNRTGLGLVNKTFADMEYAKLEQNFGRPGVIMADFLGSRAEFSQNCLKKVRDDVMNRIGGRDEDRFHASMVTAALVGAKFSNHLGLTDFDLDAMSGYLPELIEEQRGQRKMSLSDLGSPTALEGLIANYLTYRGDCTLVTDHVRTSPGKAPANWNVGKISSTTLRLIHVRVARVDRIMRISLSDFENWIKKDRNIGRNVIVDHVTRTLPGVVVTKSDLGQGTPGYDHTHRQMVLEFDLNKFDFFPA